MNCIECCKKIPKARLEILPDTNTCVKCSSIEKRVGIMAWDKSTPELLIVESVEAEVFWALERIDGRLGRLK